MALGDVYVVRVESLRDLIEVYDREVAMLEARIHGLLRHDHGYQTIQVRNGVGRTIAAIFVAEIGDVHRFRSAEALCSWAGLAPRHRESDTKVVRGSITKMGSRLVRWAALEAIARHHGGDWLQGDFHRIAERRGRNKARVAVAQQAPHARLLRPARRRHPLSARASRGVSARTRPLRRARRTAWLPHTRRSRRM
jgi:transposase